MRHSTRKLEWASTVPSGRAHTCEVDDGVTGWKLHLIEPGTNSYYSVVHKRQIDISRALCGLSPRHGWGLDLFIDTPCRRCLAAATKAGIALPEIP